MTDLATYFTPANIPARPSLDWEGWPVDAVDALRPYCAITGMNPPKHKKDKSLWIQDARRLSDACGEFGVEPIMKDVFCDWMQRAHKGDAYDIKGPGSFVGACRMAAMLKRAKPSQQAIPWGRA